MKRSSLREQIFKILFRMEFNPESELKEQEELFFGSGDLTVTKDDRTYIESKTQHIMEARGEIDALLTERMKGWTLDRVGKVELAVLRLAVYEIEFDPDVPAGVAISEAVELAKKFGSEKSGSFVNGVLSRFVPKDSKVQEKDPPAAGSEDGELSQGDNAAAGTRAPAAAAGTSQNRTAEKMNA